MLESKESIKSFQKVISLIPKILEGLAIAKDTDAIGCYSEYPGTSREGEGEDA